MFSPEKRTQPTANKADCFRYFFSRIPATALKSGTGTGDGHPSIVGVMVREKIAIPGPEQ